MVSLTSLALPVLISAVVVFLASFILHMLLPFHRSDFKQLPAEAEVAEALRRFNIPAGDYMMPKPGGPSEMKSPEFQERWKKGPKLLMTVWTGENMTMGPQLAQWFVFCAVVSLFAGYIGTRALPPAAPYLKVSQIVSTTAFMGYVLGYWPNVIWYKRSGVTALKTTFDGLIYGFLTGGVFGWLWPH